MLFYQLIAQESTNHHNKCIQSHILKSKFWFRPSPSLQYFGPAQICFNISGQYLQCDLEFLSNLAKCAHFKSFNIRVLKCYLEYSIGQVPKQSRLQSLLYFLQCFGSQNALDFQKFHLGFNQIRLPYKIALIFRLLCQIFYC